MKLLPLLLFVFTLGTCLAQKKEIVTIPKGVVYNYSNPKVVERAKKLIAANLSSENDYSLLGKNIIIGPLLWKRYQHNEAIQKIEKGKVQFHVDELILDGKMTQSINDSKIIWDEFKKEVAQDYTIRKATAFELRYYWSVISFDIDEPLLIVETKNHSYILDFTKEDLKLMWLDEAPRENANKAYTTYQNGQEVNHVDKGLQETRLEKIILLSSDDEFEENSSLEDIKAILDKTTLVFEELFKDSKKSGKIMIAFELKKETNVIELAVRDDIDLEIMKEFEQRLHAEKFPNSKNKPVKFQMIFKVNSFNDTE